MEKMKIDNYILCTWIILNIIFLHYHSCTVSMFTYVVVFVYEVLYCPVHESVN